MFFYPCHLSEKFLSVILLLAQSAALQGVNRKDKQGRHRRLREIHFKMCNVTFQSAINTLGLGKEGGRHLWVYYWGNLSTSSVEYCQHIPCLTAQFVSLVLQLLEWSLDHILSYIFCIQSWPYRIPWAFNKFSSPSCCFERVPSWYDMPKSPSSCGPLPYSHI